MTGQQGYTLLELLVVLTIMGLLLTTLPTFAMHVVTSVRFSGLVHDVVHRLAFARERAVETGKTVTVTSSDLASPNIIFIQPAEHQEISFFPDGSAEDRTVIVKFGDRKQTISVDPLSGELVLN